MSALWLAAHAGDRVGPELNGRGLANPAAACRT